MSASRTLLARLSLALAAASAGAGAQATDTTVALGVTLDHADWMYRVGDTARFHVTLARGGRPVPGARVIVAIGPERLAPALRDTVALDGGGRTFAVTGTRPGFVRATVTTEIAGVRHTRLATAAFDPAAIAARSTAPADFADFWRRAVDDARKVPLAPVMTRLPRYSTPEVDVYHVSFQNHRAGSRLYGMLSVPTAPGKHPALLVVPGAGVRPYFPSVATARRGIIHLAIGIHGIPVDRDSLLYDELRATALERYWSFGAEDRDAYYYKRVYVGVVRAGDFLATLPQFDAARYAVQGGSQGGGLAIVAGALDPRVRGIAASYPAMADQFGYLDGRAGGWPHMLADTSRVKALPEKLATLRYYDVVHFARLLRVPGIYAWGYNDVTVPPTASYAAFNAITAPKEAVIVPEAGHARTPAQTEKMDAWIRALLGAREP